MFGALGSKGGFGRMGAIPSSVPPWVLSGAAIDLDFANGRYFGGSLASLLSITRASNATDLLPTSASGYVYNTYSSNVLTVSPTFGLLIFETRTNQLLNSNAPATQTTGSLGTGTWTLWCNGTGSVLPSGGTATITGAASASNGSPNTFVVTVAGTVTVTVTGSLNAFQLEQGAFGTSFIITGGATATRAADNITFIGSALTILKLSVGSARVAEKLIGDTGTFESLICSTTTNSIQALAGFSGAGNAALNLSQVGSIFSFSRRFSVGVLDSVTYRWQQSNYAGSLSGAAVVTAANAQAPVAGTTYNLGSQSGSSQFSNGIFNRASLWNFGLSNSNLQSMP